MAEVKLSDLASDFITPSLACVKPMQIDRAKPNRVLQLEGLQDTAMPTTATAKVTLNDCLACAGCSRPTMQCSQSSVRGRPPPP